MKVLLAEDSMAVVAYVRSVLESEVDVVLLPPVHDGEAAVRSVRADRPDVVLMDLELPVMDGLSAIEEIMCSAPCPIVVFSAHVHGDGQCDRTFEALNAGAVEVLAKPRGLDPVAVERFRGRLMRTLRVMAKAHVVRRWRARSSIAPLAPEPLAVAPSCEAVVVGSSTGGPVVLHELLSRLAAPYPLPIFVAQHILPGFEHGFAAWLAETGHDARVVTAPTTIEPGRVYVAPADADLRIVGPVACRVSSTSATAPSVDVLFTTAAERYGTRLAALLLTGMGRDGARGLAEVRRRGGLTITQSAESCTVDGMPRAARQLGAAQHELSPAQIVALLEQLRGAPARGAMRDAREGEGA